MFHSRNAVTGCEISGQVLSLNVCGQIMSADERISELEKTVEVLVEVACAGFRRLDETAEGMARRVEVGERAKALFDRGYYTTGHWRSEAC